MTLVSIRADNVGGLVCLDLGGRYRGSKGAVTDKACSCKTANKTDVTKRATIQVKLSLATKHSPARGTAFDAEETRTDLRGQASELRYAYPTNHNAVFLSTETMSLLCGRRSHAAAAKTQEARGHRRNPHSKAKKTPKAQNVMTCAFAICELVERSASVVWFI